MELRDLNELHSLNCASAFVGGVVVIHAFHSMCCSFSHSLQVAMHIMATELGWKGPVAPGVVPKGCLDPHGPPLFAEITHRPIASASLGQVAFFQNSKLARWFDSKKQKCAPFR